MIESAQAQVDALAQKVGAGGILHGAVIGLFTNNFNPTDATPLSAFIEPTYPGYARQNIVWSATGRDSDGNIEVTSNLFEFQMNDSSTPTTVYGYFVANTIAGSPGGVQMVLCELFGGPQALNDALSQLNFVIEYHETNDDQGDNTIIV